MPDIYVINLPRSAQRRETIAAQLRDLGLRHEFFDAVDGALGHPLFEKYDESKANSYLARPLTAGQLGCYASHYLLWLKCIETGKPLIVLEDDADINANLARFVRDCGEMASQSLCVRLFATQSKKTRKRQVGAFGQFELYRFYSSYMGTIGYYVTPKAAEKFVKHSDKWFLPVDIFMDKFWLHDVACCSVLPACLTHSEQFESDIGVRRSTDKRSLRQNLRRESLRAVEKFRKNIYLLMRRV